MKKFYFLITLLCVSAIAFAQEALFGNSNLISPEIHPDNTVTFRYLAPKAITVKVTGDFLPTQKVKTSFGEVDAPGTADLVEKEKGVIYHTATTRFRAVQLLLHRRWNQSD